MTPPPDPYRTLGIAASASDAELRVAYRRLVQLHHPDHNGGSPESARRFEEVQEAYAEARRRRQAGAGGARPRTRRGGEPQPSASSGSSAGPHPGLDARLAQMERELKAARDARDRAAAEARRAQEQTLREVREMAGERGSDEELGYFSTDDSFSKIISDAASELSGRLSDARESPAGQRVSDLIDELAAKLTGDPPDRGKPRE
jgi:curved DNA-binding protein CbpA